MRRPLETVSYLGLALTVISPLLAWYGVIAADTNRALLVVAMVMWFGTAVFWIRRGDPDA